ncbi:MAG: hypothetical protein RSD40_05400, partial [Bacilli bacterium]
MVGLFSKTKEKGIKEAIDKQFTRMLYYGIERMAQHFIDLHARYILGWGISNTHDSEFCRELLKK